MNDASVPEKMYLYCDWEGSDKEPAPPEKDGTTLDISDFDIYDNESDLQDLFICDEQSAMFVVGKLSPRKARDDNKMQTCTRALMNVVQKSKPNSKRGKKTGGRSNHYSCFG